MTRTRRDHRSSPEARAAFLLAVAHVRQAGIDHAPRQGGGYRSDFWQAVGAHLGITLAAAKERARKWGVLDQAAPATQRALCSACSRPVWSLGMCQMHYMRQYRRTHRRKA